MEVQKTLKLDVDTQKVQEGVQQLQDKVSNAAVQQAGFNTFTRAAQVGGAAALLYGGYNAVQAIQPRVEQPAGFVRDAFGLSNVDGRVMRGNLEFPTLRSAMAGRPEGDNLRNIRYNEALYYGHRDATQRVSAGITSAAATTGIAGAAFGVHHVVGGSGIMNAASAAGSTAGRGLASGGLHLAGRVAARPFSWFGPTQGIGNAILGATAPATAATVQSGTAGFLTAGARSIGGMAGGFAASMLPGMAVTYVGSKIGQQMIENLATQRQVEDWIDQTGYQYTRGQGATNLARGRGFGYEDQADMARHVRSTLGQADYMRQTDFDEIFRGIQMSELDFNVRSAEEFKEKFSKVTESLADIARLFETSLEGAVQMLGAMQRSGFYTTGDQLASLLRAEAIGRTGGMQAEQVVDIMQSGADSARSAGLPSSFGANLSASWARRLQQTPGVLGEEERTHFEQGIMELGGVEQASNLFTQFMVGVASDDEFKTALYALADTSTIGEIDGEVLQQLLSGDISFAQLMQIGESKITAGGQEEFERFLTQSDLYLGGLRGDEAFGVMRSLLQSVQEGMGFEYASTLASDLGLDGAYASFILDQTFDARGLQTEEHMMMDESFRLTMEQESRARNPLVAGWWEENFWNPISNAMQESFDITGIHSSISRFVEDIQNKYIFEIEKVTLTPLHTDLETRWRATQLQLEGEDIVSSLPVFSDVEDVLGDLLSAFTHSIAAATDEIDQESLRAGREELEGIRSEFERLFQGLYSGDVALSEFVGTFEELMGSVEEIAGRHEISLESLGEKISGFDSDVQGLIGLATEDVLRDFETNLSALRSGAGTLEQQLRFLESMNLDVDMSQVEANHERLQGLLNDFSELSGVYSELVPGTDEHRAALAELNQIWGEITNLFVAQQNQVKSAIGGSFDEVRQIIQQMEEGTVGAADRLSRQMDFLGDVVMPSAQERLDADTSFSEEERQARQDSIDQANTLIESLRGLTTSLGNVERGSTEYNRLLNDISTTYRELAPHLGEVIEDLGSGLNTLSQMEFDSPEEKIRAAEDQLALLQTAIQQLADMNMPTGRLNEFSEELVELLNDLGELDSEEFDRRWQEIIRNANAHSAELARVYGTMVDSTEENVERLSLVTGDLYTLFQANIETQGLHSSITGLQTSVSDIALALNVLGDLELGFDEQEARNVRVAINDTIDEFLQIAETLRSADLNPQEHEEAVRRMTELWGTLAGLVDDHGALLEGAIGERGASIERAIRSLGEDLEPENLSGLSSELEAYLEDLTKIRDAIANSGLSPEQKEAIFSSLSAGEESVQGLQTLLSDLEKAFLDNDTQEQARIIEEINDNFKDLSLGAVLFGDGLEEAVGKVSGHVDALQSLDYSSLTGDIAGTLDGLTRTAAFLQSQMDGLEDSDFAVPQFLSDAHSEVVGFLDEIQGAHERLLALSELDLGSLDNAVVSIRDGLSTIGASAQSLSEGIQELDIANLSDAIERLAGVDVQTFSAGVSETTDAISDAISNLSSLSVDDFLENADTTLDGLSSYIEELRSAIEIMGAAGVDISSISAELEGFAESIGDLNTAVETISAFDIDLGEFNAAKGEFEALTNAFGSAAQSVVGTLRSEVNGLAEAAATLPESESVSESAQESVDAIRRTVELISNQADILSGLDDVDIDVSGLSESATEIVNRINSLVDDLGDAITPEDRDEIIERIQYNMGYITKAMHDKVDEIGAAASGLADISLDDFLYDNEQAMARLQTLSGIVRAFSEESWDASNLGDLSTEINGYVQRLDGLAEIVSNLDLDPEVIAEAEREIERLLASISESAIEAFAAVEASMSLEQVLASAAQLETAMSTLTRDFGAMSEAVADDDDLIGLRDGLGLLSDWKTRISELTTELQNGEGDLEHFQGVVAEIAELSSKIENMYDEEGNFIFENMAGAFENAMDRINQGFAMWEDMDTFDFEGASQRISMIGSALDLAVFRASDDDIAAELGLQGEQRAAFLENAEGLQKMYTDVFSALEAMDNANDMDEYLAALGNFQDAWSLFMGEMGNYEDTLDLLTKSVRTNIDDFLALNREISTSTSDIATQRILAKIQRSAEGAFAVAYAGQGNEQVQSLMGDIRRQNFLSGGEVIEDLLGPDDEEQRAAFWNTWTDRELQALTSMYSDEDNANEFVRFLEGEYGDPTSAAAQHRFLFEGGREELAPLVNRLMEMHSRGELDFDSGFFQTDSRSAFRARGSDFWLGSANVKDLDSDLANRVDDLLQRTSEFTSIRNEVSETEDIMGSLARGGHQDWIDVINEVAQTLGMDPNEVAQRFFGERLQAGDIASHFSGFTDSRFGWWQRAQETMVGWAPVLGSLFGEGQAGIDARKEFGLKISELLMDEGVLENEKEQELVANFFKHRDFGSALDALRESSAFVAMHPDKREAFVGILGTIAAEAQSAIYDTYDHERITSYAEILGASVEERADLLFGEFDEGVRMTKDFNVRGHTITRLTPEAEQTRSDLESIENVEAIRMAFEAGKIEEMEERLSEMKRMDSNNPEIQNLEREIAEALGDFSTTGAMMDSAIRLAGREFTPVLSNVQARAREGTYGEEFDLRLTDLQNILAAAAVGDVDDVTAQSLWGFGSVMHMYAGQTSDSKRRASLEKSANILQSVRSGEHFSALLDEDVARNLQRISPEMSDAISSGIGLFELLDDVDGLSERDWVNRRDNIIGQIESGEILAGYNQRDQALSTLRSGELDDRDSFKNFMEVIFNDMLSKTVATTGDHTLFMSMSEQRLQANLQMMLGENNRVVEEAGAVMSDLKTTIEQTGKLFDRLDIDWARRAGETPD